ncbi:toxin YdaT family protein [Veronia pacifica]|uniref:Uncharacterized protein n=1 Tax=Veronia pacifica TaxID=1080227 RepID=A0A1C3E9N3_9GAMM|nr:toxin YdaT family protein [Veronia pacifica]ODA29879.1 hypothetical protein A8L45_21505 [Veronia pacifica]
MTTQSFKAVIRNAVEGWRTQVSKDYIATNIARQYHTLTLAEEIDAQRKTLLKPPGADDKNNQQNFFRYLERTSIEAKATILDLLPAILAAMPKARGVDMLNTFLNPLGFTVAEIGSNSTAANRDKLLAEMSKESSEALSAILLLPENASLQQLRAAYKEVQESEGAHKPALEYIEALMQHKHAA